MAETLTIRTASSTEVVKIAVPGPQGPKGDKGDPGDVAGLPLSTQGDTLYRGASQNERLAIGTTGQVLKVSAQGLPTWANESGAVTSVNGATGAVTVAAATHAVEHEPGYTDAIQATAALVTTNSAGLNGIYFSDDTSTNDKLNFFRTGTRKNTKLQYNSNTLRWELIRNLTVEAESIEDDHPTPWGQSWSDPRTPAQVTSITVARVALETMVQKLAETGGAATATTSEDGLMSSSDKTKLNGISANATANTASSATPSALGTASAGSATDYARADHIHSAEVSDSAFRVTGSTDATKKVALEVDTNVPANTTVTLTAPSASGTLALAGAAPSAHAASHAAGGSDPLAPSDIGAQSLFTSASQVLSADFTLTSGRATKWTLQNYNGATYNVTLPTTNIQAGDVVVVAAGTLVGFQTIREANVGGGSFVTLATLSEGQSYRFVSTGTASNSWEIDQVYTHTHAASDITSGTLTHERGGLEADVSAYSGLVKISSGSTSAVTVTSAGEALLDDADAAAQRTTLGLGTAATAATGDFAAASHTHAASAINSGTLDIARIPTGSTSTTVALGNHSHELTALAATGATNGHVLTANGSGGVTFAAASGGIGGSTGATDRAILRASGTGGATAQNSALNVEDASTTTENNVAITNQHSGQTNSSLVLTPKGTGAFIVGPRPDGTATGGGNARGAGAICIQTSRNAANQVASAADSIAIGNRSRSSSALGESVAIGFSTTASGSYSTCVGGRSTATGTYTCAFGHDADATQSGAIALGDRTTSSTAGGVAVGSQASATNDRAIAIGESASCSGQYAMSAGYAVSATANFAIALNSSASLRAQFATLPFSAVYWGGQTTNNTATILNLDATATNRFTIAANTALAVDVLLVARRSDVADKWLVARRFLGIRRDGSNNTSLIGAVQTLGTDQSAGSPTWTFALTADDTNDALQLEVTGATGETVQWRACAIYRVV